MYTDPWIGVRERIAEKGNVRCRWDCLLQDGGALGPEGHSWLAAHARDVPAGAGVAFDESGLNRIGGDANDRNAAGGLLELACEGSPDSQDRIGLMAHDFARQTRVPLGPPLSRKALDEEVSALDIAVRAHPFEEGLEMRKAGCAEVADRVDRRGNRQSPGRFRLRER